MVSAIFITLLFITGIYCIMASYNLVRVLIGVEILIKAVTLMIIVVGSACGRLALAQSLVITLIVVEVVVITVAVGVVLGIHTHNNSLDVRKVRRLKG
ncbi:MAG: NADH-quinone oxidoreductase subunit K [Candidatus Omnitrophica bacterium]|nr:NADH-quinone oxidoreductase subunit K [Candidatus Omnitrophota bacterium]